MHGKIPRFKKRCESSTSNPQRQTLTSRRRCFDATYELLVWLKVLEREVLVEWDEEDYLETLPDALADDIVNLVSIFFVGI